MCQILLGIGVVISYLLIGAVTGGLIQRWKLGPRDFGGLSIIAWPLTISMLLLIGILLSAWIGLELIMDKISGE